MKDKFTPILFDKKFNITHIYTLFYMEIPKDFKYDGESHDFWEMVYIDKGEMICTANENRFILKSGEIVFHKPNEYHNLTGNGSIEPNVSIVTFACKSSAMKNFEDKIFKLSAKEKGLLSMIFEEGMASFKLTNENSPLMPITKKRTNTPFGSSQMTKNLLEIFLINLCRNTDIIYQNARESFIVDGENVPFEIKEVLDLLKDNIYNKITIKDISVLLNKSESAIKQLFYNYKKGGIMHYFNNLKIREAKRLVKESNHNITQISDMLGFDNPQYFSKCFKKNTNMTPTEYKRSIIK